MRELYRKVRSSLWSLQFLYKHNLALAKSFKQYQTWSRHKLIIFLVQLYQTQTVNPACSDKASYLQHLITILGLSLEALDALGRIWHQKSVSLLLVQKPTAEQLAKYVANQNGVMGVPALVFLGNFSARCLYLHICRWEHRWKGFTFAHFPHHLH